MNLVGGRKARKYRGIRGPYPWGHLTSYSAKRRITSVEGVEAQPTDLRLLELQLALDGVIILEQPDGQLRIFPPSDSIRVLPHPSRRGLDPEYVQRGGGA